NVAISVAVALALGAVTVAIDLLTPNKKIATLFSVFFGLVIALVLAVAGGFVIDLIAASWEIEAPRIIGTVKVLFGICLSYLTVAAVLQTQDDFRLVIPYVEFAKQIRGPRPILLDTSAIIDARIRDVAETGLLQTPLVIPQFVVDELQALADSADAMRRAKGRRGLEVVDRMRRSAKMDVTIDERPVPGHAVDHKLVELARQIPAILATSDVALARIASIRGVPTLNINDLAAAMR